MKIFIIITNLWIFAKSSPNIKSLRIFFNPECEIWFFCFGISLDEFNGFGSSYPVHFFYEYLCLCWCDCLCSFFLNELTPASLNPCLLFFFIWITFFIFFILYFGKVPFFSPCFYEVKFVLLYFLRFRA